MWTWKTRRESESEKGIEGVKKVCKTDSLDSIKLVGLTWRLEVDFGLNEIGKWRRSSKVEATMTPDSPEGECSAYTLIFFPL